MIITIGIIGVLLFLFALRPRKSPEEQRAEEIILAYIAEKGLNIRPGTEKYAQFMKGILLGEHPDLTGKDSVFIESPEELDYIINYATQHMNLRQFRKYKEPEAQEVQP